MTELSDWVDQLSAELQKQTFARAAQVESLLRTGDYAAIRELIDEWEVRDATGGSLRKRYQSAVKELGAEKRRFRYGQIFERLKSRASAARPDISSASPSQPTDVNQLTGD